MQNCEICKIPKGVTCWQNPLTKVIRFQKEKGVENTVFERIEDCPIRKANSKMQPPQPTGNTI